MRFSLVLSTIGRVDDLRRFFQSLRQQTYSDFEVLVVDDLGRESVQDLIRCYQKDLRIEYLGSVAGHSRALNMGLVNATGDILAFPDDDCWYAPALLETVASSFKEHPEWGCVTGRCVTEEGHPSSGRWDLTPGLITRTNVWLRASSVTMFFRRTAVGSQSFDETLGVGSGTPWGAGEDPDFLLRTIGAGHMAYYDPTIMVNHPEWKVAPYTRAVCSKARSYGMGLGRVLRKHNYPLTAVAYQVIRPLGGALLSLCTFRKNKAAYHWAAFSGRVNGWITGVKDRPVYPVNTREMAR